MRYSLFRFLISFFLLVVACNAEEASKTPVFSKDLLQKAESGDAAAQLEIAACYGEGLGVEKNQKTAFDWVKKSADQGFSKASLVLARCYLFGWGVPWNESKAEKIFQEAEAGNPRAQDDLGNFFSGKYGRTEKKDIPQALSWWEKAAAQGYVPSQNKLGRAYLDGFGVEKDPKKAFEFYQKSAESGNPDAQNIMGWLYYNGMTPDAEKEKDPRKPAYRKKDLQKAFEWTRKSAENGNPDAQFNLGIFYWRGDGTEADLEKARLWMGKAAEKNVPKAKETLGWITLDRNVKGISENWFSLGEDSKKQSPTNP